MDDAWLTQTTGEINHHDPKQDIGNQPVRVLHKILKFFFYTSSESFAYELYTLMKGGGIKQEIKICTGDEPLIQSPTKQLLPQVDANKQLEIHETFLSYVWCISYSMYILFNETVDYPNINISEGSEVYKQNPKEIQRAENLLEYGLSLIHDFKEWDKDKLPNPEIFQAELKDYTQQSSHMFTEAIKWILAHEYTHIRDHIDQLTNTTTASHIFSWELEADESATEIMKKSIEHKDEDHSIFVHGGVVCAILSLLFLSSKSGSVDHPNTEDRLTHALEQLEIDDHNFSWGMACLGMKYWGNIYGKKIELKKAGNSYKDLYYFIIKQIKSQ